MGAAIRAFDVAVVGAGPAGSATAGRLARAGLRVVLLEKSRFDQPRVGETLGPDVQPLLRALGLWPEFLALQPLPSYGNRSAWGSATVLDHSNLVTPWQHGWHVDRARFDHMLALGAARAGADLRLGTCVRGCIDRGDHFAIRVGDDRQELRARFVIDATGRGAGLARSLRARHAVFDRLVAVAAHFADEDAHAHCYTLVETTADGWWYCAPIGIDRCVVMLMSDGDLVRTSRLADPNPWERALERTSAIAERLKHRGHAASWRTGMIPAISQRLRRSCMSQWLAVGDAALAVDPVSGSGVIRALQMAEKAAATILASFPANEAPLKEYEAALDADCTDYLVERAHYYNLEQRWRSPFWQRRALRQVQ